MTIESRFICSGILSSTKYLRLGRLPRILNLKYRLKNSCKAILLVSPYVAPLITDSEVLSRTVKIIEREEDELEIR